jgi:hypothetical protein
MFTEWKGIASRQLGAAIDMLGNAMRACPESLWGDEIEPHEFWYIVFHTLFFLDCYLSDAEETFRPPAPFTLSELDPSGKMPPRVYTRPELEAYLEHGRRKVGLALGALSEEGAMGRCGIARLNMSVAELLVYLTRHIQHHAAQLNLLLHQHGATPPRWVRQGSQ